MSCGAKLQPAFRFCGSCREPVPLDAETSSQPVILETGTEPSAPPSTAPAPPPPLIDSADGFKKPSRKTVIVSTTLLVLAAVGIGAFFYVQNLIRGGAGSAEAAADKLIEAVEDKDLVGLLTMIAPQERNALQRIQETVEDRMSEHGITDAFAKVSNAEDGDNDAGTDISFDGIDISLGGAEPVITEIDEHLAAITFATGELRVQIDPAETKGAIRAAFEAGGSMEAVDESMPFASMGRNNSGVTLMATETDGRWFISPLYSGLEFSQQFSNTSRGYAPQTVPGSDSPSDAARSAVGVLPQMVSSGSVLPLAPYLSSYEGNALHYYSGLLDAVMDGSSSSFFLGEVAFRDGGKDGDRAQAVVENITVESGYGDRINLTSNCLLEEGEEQMCANGSGYGLRYGGSPEADGLSVLNSSQAWSLTTVKEDGKYKVSLLDSAADWAVGWVESLTREQALALLDLARSEDASGEMVIGEETEISFNSAGYAVRTMTLEEEQSVEFRGTYGRAHIYRPDGREQLAVLGGNADPKQLEPGEYKLVIFAGTDWTDKFASDGSGVQYSAPVTVQKYISPPQINGSQGSYSGTIYTESFGNSATDHELQVAEGNNVELVITVSGSYSGSSAPGILVVTLDGNRYQIPVGESEEQQVIPYPADSNTHTLGLELDKGGKFGSAGYSLEFVQK